MTIKQIGTMFTLRWHLGKWHEATYNAAFAYGLMRDLTLYPPYIKLMDDEETQRCAAVLRACGASGNYKVEPVKGS